MERLLMAKGMLHVEMYEDLYDIDTTVNTYYADTVEERIENLRDKKIVKYCVKTIKSGPVLECEIYPVMLGMQTDKRTERKLNNSKRSQRNLNLRNAQKYLVRLCNRNFGKGDMWATLGYDDKHLPSTAAQAKKDMQNYIRRLQRYVKKHGYPELKYIYVTEYGDVRIHHHLITNFPDRNVAEELWGKCKYPRTRNLEPTDTGLTGLARYIGKEIKGSKRAVQEKSYTPSRNLKQPVVTRAYSKITRKKAEKIATQQIVPHEVFEKMYKGYQFEEMEVKYSYYMAGAYIYASMKRIEDIPVNSKKRKDE